MVIEASARLFWGPRIHTKGHERICCANECLRHLSHGSHRSTRIFVWLENDLLYSIRVNLCYPWPAFLYFFRALLCVLVANPICRRQNSSRKVFKTFRMMPHSGFYYRPYRQPNSVDLLIYFSVVALFRHFVQVL